MPEAMTFEGRCSCGEVRFRMNSPPLIVHACHCTECQRLSGGAFAINALIEADRVETLSGTPEPVPVIGTSGKPQSIYRCPRCRVALWSHYPGGGTKVSFIRVGTLEEASRLPPDIHIYTSTKLPWLALPPDVPAVAEYYSAREVWSEESLERSRRLRER
jgi:hypothetical protein